MPYQVVNVNPNVVFNIGIGKPIIISKRHFGKHDTKCGV